MEKGGRIEAFRPGKHFPSVSVTGDRCDLMCDHCRGEHLKGMHPAMSAEALMETAQNIKEDGGAGILISGGCDVNGKVPVSHLTDAVSRISGMGLEINMHAGLIDRREAEDLVSAGVDVFSMDIHQDPAVIRNVLRMDTGPDAYSRTIDNIMEASGRVVPHLTAGFGTDDLIMSADLIRRKGLKEVILLALVPTKNTEIHVPLSMESILQAARILIGMGLDVTLGCMRPRCYRDLEIECIRAGVRRIANPSTETVRWAEENGFSVMEIRKCCSLTP